MLTSWHVVAGIIIIKLVLSPTSWNSSSETSSTSSISSSDDESAAASAAAGFLVTLSNALPRFRGAR